MSLYQIISTKMLRLYIDTLISGYKRNSVFNVLNIRMRKDLHDLMGLKFKQCFM